MKTSNKILLSFLIFLFGGIIALYVGSKCFSDYYGSSNLETQEKSLASFSVVVAESGAIFYLRSEKENKIIQPYRKGTVAIFPAFTVRNDTLFVPSSKQIQGLPKNYRIGSEICCIKIKSIITKENSNVTMHQFKADTLNITMNKSRLNWNFDNVSFLLIQAKDSDVYLGGKNLKKLAVKLDKTKLRAATKSRINNLSGSLMNGSDGDFSYADSTRLEIDKTSSYSFYDFVN
jgi:hypothetical protein